MRGKPFEIGDPAEARDPILGMMVTVLVVDRRGRSPVEYCVTTGGIEWWTSILGKASEVKRGEVERLRKKYGLVQGDRI
jgi:hypothetical protein